MIVVDLEHQIKDLIEQGKLAEALEVLKENCTEASLENEIIQQISRLNLLEKESRSGTLSRENYQQERSVLVDNILQLTPKVCAEPSEDQPLEEVLATYRTTFNLSLVRIRVAQLLLQTSVTQEALDLTTILKRANVHSRKLTLDFLQELHELKFIEKNRVSERMCWLLTEIGTDYLTKWLNQ